MSFNVSTLILLSIGYLLLLFGIAWLANKGVLSQKITNHPLVYVFSLGIYSSIWTFYGVIGFAHQYGTGYIVISLGLTGAFLASAILLSPILRLTKNYQLSSLADLLAFRYCSRWAGFLTTTFMLLGMMPLYALQIKAITQSVAILTGSTPSHWIPFMFCFVLAVFALLLGSKQISSREKRTGLVVAIAFESFIKLFVFIVTTLYVVYFVFDGFNSVNDWYRFNTDLLIKSHTILSDAEWRVMLLAFFASPIVMPQLFHMLFSEHATQKVLAKASWGVPLFILSIAFCIPIILWAGLYQRLTIDPDYFILGIGTQSHNIPLTLLIYIGGLSGASSLIIIGSIALSGMIMNHVILSFYKVPNHINIYDWLKWVRRTLIILIVLLGYFCYLITESEYDNNILTITAFIATLQFFPGILSLLYWKRANKKGFISGLIAGALCWIVIMLIPLISGYHISLPFVGKIYTEIPDGWYYACSITTFTNVTVFIIISLCTKTSPEENYAAEICAINTVHATYQYKLLLNTPKEFINALSSSLGEEVAEQEVKKALADLNYPLEEQRPYALRRLRERIEVNLSGLIGPHSAKQIVNTLLPYASNSTQPKEDIHFIENYLEHYQNRLTGLAAELNALRRYHRLTLEALPIGVCCLSQDQEIILWNKAIEKLTNIPFKELVGANITILNPVWQELFNKFIHSSETHIYKQHLEIAGQVRWFNLHKAILSESFLTQNEGLVILIEEITSTHALEERLIHAGRLASIGRLAAGVAHEIGNPVTSIACLAQILRDEWYDDPEVVKMSAQIIEQTKRITRIVQSLVTFAHAGKQIKEISIIKLNTLVSESIELLELNKNNRDIHFMNLVNPEHTVVADYQRIIQVIINLLNNAQDASPTHGTITINSYEHTDMIELTITDEGKGIPAEIITQIFEPFFTTKDPSQGTGLGLPLAYSIINDHHGDISVKSPIDSKTNFGTTFSITLPKHIESNSL